MEWRSKEFIEEEDERDTDKREPNMIVKEEKQGGKNVPEADLNEVIDILKIKGASFFNSQSSEKMYK